MTDVEVIEVGNEEGELHEAEIEQEEWTNA